MPPQPQTSAERLAEIRAGWPDAVRLAEPLALAARIEPELLRAVRLAFYPKSPASMEAEFYFSPLVSQRTPQWVVFDTAIAHELQAGLAKVAPRSGLDRIRTLVRRAHSTIPYEIESEEEMIWLSVVRPRDAKNLIDGILRGFLPSLAAGGEAAETVARWFASAAKRLPLVARETPSFPLLGFAASCILKGRKVDTGVTPAAETFEALAAFLPETAPRLRIWAALTSRGFHVVPDEARGYQPFEIPLTYPLLLDIRAEGEDPRLAMWEPGKALFLPLGGTAVTFRTLGRELVTFRARVRGQEPSGGAAKPPASGTAGRRVHITFDYADEEFAQRLATELRELGHQLLESAEGAGCLIAVLSPAAVHNPGLNQRISDSSAKGNRVIGVFAKRTPGYEWPIRVQIDLSDPGAFYSARDELQAAILEIDRPFGRLTGVPELPPNYSPRPELVRRLHERLEINQIPIAIVGLPGAGSLLAREYARSQEALSLFSDGVVWYRPGEYGAARELSPGRRLLVFDDVDDAAEFNRLVWELRGGTPLVVARSMETARSLTLPVFEIPRQMPVFQPLGAAIVLTRKLMYEATVNVDFEIRNPETQPQRIDLIRCRITGPHRDTMDLRWTVFYEVAGSLHRRSGQARPIDAELGVTHLGIQFRGPGEAWSPGVHLVEFEIILDGLPPERLVARSEMTLTSRDLSAIYRWLRAPDTEWSKLDDEAVGIPVQLKEAHRWPFRIAGERFVDAYSEAHRGSQDIRDDLLKLIERINDDRDIDDPRVAAYLLATVANETGGAFRPMEQDPKARLAASSKGPGRGDRYWGRGYILLEGRENYLRLSQALRMDDMLVRNPDMLLDPGVAYRALNFILLKGGLTGHPITEFITSRKSDYLAARRAGFGTARFGERVAKDAEMMEELVRASLVPRYPTPRSEPDFRSSGEQAE